MIEYIKKNWIMVSVLGFSIVFSSRLFAVWNLPNQADETQKQVSQLSASLDKYVAGQESANQQRDKLIELLTKKAMHQ